MDIRALEEHDAAGLARFLGDFRRAGEPRIPAYFCDHDWPIAQVVASLRAWARGEVPHPWVPCTTRFAIDGEDVLGVVNVRHHLDARLAVFGGHVGYSVRPGARGRGVATALLRDAMRFGASLGIDVLTLTTAPDNVASQRVIERCGGVLRDRYRYAPEDRDVLRYDLPSTP